MRWNNTHQTMTEWFDSLSEYPKVGTRRLTTRFLIIPTQIGNDRRWLEMATIEQEYCRGGYGGLVGGDWWENIGWCDSGKSRMRDTIVPDLDRQAKRIYILLTVAGMIALFLCPILILLASE